MLPKVLQGLKVSWTLKYFIGIKGNWYAHVQFFFSINVWTSIALK